MNHSFPLYYETLGNPKNPCIIFIMGLNGQLIHWPTELTQGLAEEGFYVVIFDNRDVGLSRYYDDLGTPDINEALAAKQQGKLFHPPYTLNDMACDVIGLMDELRIKKAHIAGTSMGGMISQIAALDYPERVLSLTCIASTSGDPALPPAKPEVLEFLFSPQKQAEDLESQVNNNIQLRKIYNHPDYIDEDKIRALYTKTYLRAHNSFGFKRQLLAIICAEPRVEKLKKLKTPTLIIHGDQDPVFPIEHGKQLAEVLPNARLEIIEKMGHGLPEPLCPKIVEISSAFYHFQEKH